MKKKDIRWQIKLKLPEQPIRSIIKLVQAQWTMQVL
jgi:hypothetical protein